MKTAQIVTIKPQDGIVEYQIIDAAGVIVSHGHQFAIDLTPDLTGAGLQVSVNGDAESKGLLTP